MAPCKRTKREQSQEQTRAAPRRLLENRETKKMKNEKKVKKDRTTLPKAIASGEIKITVLKGGDSRSCPSCKSYNAMCCRGEIPAGFEQHELWAIGLDAYACRDCGRSTVSQVNGDTWTNETTHELFVDGERTGATCAVSNIHPFEEQGEMVHKVLHREIDAAIEKSDDVETRAIHNGWKSCE